MRLRLPNPLTALDDRALLARFADDRDQHSFEQLVRRHGRLVFGVCRRVTRNDADAEDAFQAVFLVLARDPRRAAEASSVGGWLFGVARRVGLAARRHEQRREKREQAAPPAHLCGSTGGEFDDLLRVLDDELAALPDDLRAPLVACFLQERTQDEAARELGWSLSTLRRRLDRGKELLRARLTRRGVTLAAGLLAVGIAAPATAAPPLAPPSSTALALAAEVMRRGVGLKWLALLAGTALAVGGVAFGLTRAPADTPETPFLPKVAPITEGPVRPVAPAPRPVEPRKWATVSGRVVFERARELPKPKLVPANLVKDADVWKPFGPLAYTGTTISPDTRGVADVIVFLRPDSDDRKADFPADRVHPARAAKPTDRSVTIAGPHFAPRIVAARTGDRLVFENKLPVAVTVAYTATGDPGGNPKVRFNVMLARGDTYASDPLTATIHVDQFANHIHPWMDGFVWAFDHPYFAVTDANGRFELPDVPVGAWRLVAWHQVAGWSATGRLGTKVVVANDRDRRELDPITLAADSWTK